MTEIIAVLILLVILALLARRKPVQELHRETLYRDSQVEVIALDGISGIANGNYWKAIFLFPATKSFLERFRLKQHNFILRIAQSPTGDAPSEGGLGIGYLKYELSAPSIGLFRTFQDLHYLDFNPTAGGASQSFEIMVDNDVYVIPHHFEDSQAERLVDFLRQWLIGKTLKFAWEGVSTKSGWLAGTYSVSPEQPSQIRQAECTQQPPIETGGSRCTD